MDPNNGTTFIDTNFEDYVSFSKGVLVLLLRAGFVLIQISCVPSNNVNKLVFQNLADMGISTALYICIGYTLAFGEDIAGIVGTPGWVPVREIHSDAAVLGWSTIILSGAIFTAAVAGRISVLGQVMSSALLAGVVQPLVLHWVFSSDGWLRGYRDQGGGATAHASGGMAALIGTAFLGRRLLLLRELDECSLPPSSPGNIFTGYILLMTGLLAMSHPRTAVINNMAAAGGAALAIAILQKAMGSIRLDYWRVVTCFQGAVAGIVTVAPGLDIYHPTLAFALGAFGAMVCHVVTRLCSICFLEDYINLVPVHLMCGILGTLFPPVYSPDSTRGDVDMEIRWQLLGVLAIVGFTAAALMPLFCIMTWCAILRDETEMRNHLRALRVANDNASVFWLGRIFRSHRGLPQLRPGYRSKDVESFLDRICEEPGTHSEVPNVHSAGEPSNTVQISEDTSRPQEVRQPDYCTTDRDNQASLSGHRHHLVVFGREPLTKGFRLENSSASILQDSNMELVECGTPDNHCASQKLHQVCCMNTDERYPTTISAHELPSSSMLIPNTEATVDEQRGDFQKWFTVLIEKSFQQNIDQNTTENIDEIPNLESPLQGKNIEDENLEEMSSPLKVNYVSEMSLDAISDACPTGCNSLPNIVDYKMNPETFFSKSTKEVDRSVMNVIEFGHTNNDNTLHSPILLAYQRCASEQSLNTSFLSRTTYSRRKEKSDSNLTAENDLQIKPISMKSQLEVSAGDGNADTKTGYFKTCNSMACYEKKHKHTAILPHSNKRANDIVNFNI